MKYIYLFLFLVAMAPFNMQGQTGYWSDYMSGSFNEIDLSNAGLTTLGSTVAQISAADMDDSGNLYAISNSDNGLYQIDTTDGTGTFIGTSTPPPDHVWTGMAFDEASGIMYANCSKGGALGESSLYTIDLASGQITLIGSQNVAKSISCIAIDGSGTLYGVDAAASSKLYIIDKNNGAATYVATMYISMAGMGHGMDWNNNNSTMYLATYNSIDMTNSLRTVNLNSGGTVEVGSLPSWTGMFVANNVLIADFSSDVTSLCTGNQVHFTDQSTGATSWQWTFEGGIPASSTLQNPIVLYNTPGDFDVTLEVSNGTGSNTLVKPNYIHVTGEPSPCATPTGDTLACNDASSVYSSNGSPESESYVWELYPAEAGVITPDFLDVTIDWNPVYTGLAYLSLYGVNSCGTGMPSDSLLIHVDDCTIVKEHDKSFFVTVNPNPVDDFVTINSSAAITEISIFNATGKQVLQTNTQNTSTQLKVSSLPSGIYVVSVKTRSGDRALKFVKR